MFTAYIYWLWRARNIKNLEGKESIVDTFRHLIMHDARVKMMGNGYAMVESEEKKLMEDRWV